MILDVVVAVIAVVELVAAARPLPDVVDFFDPSTVIGCCCCPLLLIFPFISIAVVAPLLLAVGLLEVEAVVVAAAAAAADRDEDSAALIIKLNQHYQIFTDSDSFNAIDLLPRTQTVKPTPSLSVNTLGCRESAACPADYSFD